MSVIKILAEQSVPYLRGVLEDLGEVSYLASSDFCPETVRDKDWLIVRSITKCNEALLKGSKVKLITSATIGFDHIDTDYCDRHGITWHNAPGCNAEAVGQYMGGVWAKLEKAGVRLRGKTLGIVGVGHVGKVVERYALAWGMKVLKNDPPRAEQEGERDFVSLKTVLEEADLISFHTPLTRQGQYPTFHLFNEACLSQVRRQTILINACRGAVTATEALLRGIAEGKIQKPVIDCWENEPNISTNLLQETFNASPHIAGFSADGKSNGARRCVEWGMSFFGLHTEKVQTMSPEAPVHPDIFISNNDEHPLCTAIGETINTEATDAELRKGYKQFEQLRRRYTFPREPHAYRVHINKKRVDDIQSLSQIGFNCIEVDT